MHHVVQGEGSGKRQPQAATEPKTVEDLGRLPGKIGLLFGLYSNLSSLVVRKGGRRPRRKSSQGYPYIKPHVALLRHMNMCSVTGTYLQRARAFLVLDAVKQMRLPLVEVSVEMFLTVVVGFLSKITLPNAGAKN